MIEGFRGQKLDAHYLGYFECFNQGLYYEAHDVLEELWLPSRKGPNDAFYRGLIQLAGAFVHLQKNRIEPSARLFKMARANLVNYQSPHEHLEMEPVLSLIDDWLRLAAQSLSAETLLNSTPAPKLQLIEWR